MTMIFWPAFRLPAVTNLQRCRRVVGRYFRTSDLAASSVNGQRQLRADYHRSRMLAFERVIAIGPTAAME